MSSRGKNFRRRSGSEDDKDVETKTLATTNNAAAAAPKPKPRPSKLLSFGDEEDDSPVPPRPARPPSSSQPKSSSAHKLTSAKERAAAAPSPPVPSTLQSQAGEYTEERLLELRKNTRHLGSVPRYSQLASSRIEQDPPRRSSRPEASGEPVIVLKGLVKPVQAVEKERQPNPRPPPPPQQISRDERQLTKEEEEEEGEEEEANGMDSSRFSRLGIHKKGKDSSLIPDQATINAIRAKRERLRQAGSAAPDYISLDGSGAISTRASSTGGSSDEEDTEFRGRIALLGDKKDGSSRKGVFESVDERIDMVVGPRTTNGVFVDGDDEDDEEERKWEEEQFRKGLGKKLDDASSSSQLGSTTGVASVPFQPPRPAYSQQIPQDVSPIAGSVSRSAEVLSIAQHAEVATRALQQNISKLKETHGRTLLALVKTDNSLVESLSSITDLEKALETAGDKFVYMQELRRFISVVCDFLQDKAPYIEELEENKQKLHENRASAIQERRATDFADEMAKVEPAITAAMSILSKGSGSAYISAATNAAQAAVVAARENSDRSAMDEFGRDLNLQKHTDNSRRAVARKRRKFRSETKRMSMGRDGTGQLVEGECSTDESDSESQAYTSTQSELLHTAGGIFSDAADEYSDLSVVKDKFEEWKDRYSSSYRDAYMALSAPDIFSPYVRIELLKWNPLYEDLDFNVMKWHNVLFDYGQQKNGNFDPDDPDEKLIPVLVERVALPILHHEIASCWDVLSTRMTLNAVSAARLVMTYIPASEALRDFLAAVHARLEEAVTNLVVPTWSTTVIRIVPEAAPIAAYQFGVSIRLLRNISLWKDILSMPLLENLALGGLLCGKVLPHLQSIMPNIYDAVTRTERVIASLSGVWSGPDGKNSQKLQPLVDWVYELGRKLDKRHASGVGEDTIGLARRLKKMMVDLNEYDKARAILRTFQIKEAL